MRNTGSYQREQPWVIVGKGVRGQTARLGSPHLHQSRPAPMWGRGRGGGGVGGLGGKGGGESASSVYLADLLIGYSEHVTEKPGQRRGNVGVDTVLTGGPFPGATHTPPLTENLLSDTSSK